MSTLSLAMRRSARGFSLIELMIAMVLGLIVIAGAGSVFIASSRTYQTNNALSDVQTNARISFELLARDFRNAGQSPCNNNGRVANTINNPSSLWFTDWNNALHGYEAGQVDPAITGAMPARAASTDSVQVLGAGTLGLSVAAPSASAANFKLNTPTTKIVTGDLIMVCDPSHTALLQVTNYNASNKTVVHNNGVGSPGNCTKGLGWPTVCTSNGNAYTFQQNAQVAKIEGHDWYIGTSTAADGSQIRSLYRVDIVNVGGVPTAQAQEMVRNVEDMQLTYLQNGNTLFKPADQITNWADVTAVHAELKLQSTDKRAGTNFSSIDRKFTSTTTIRNRVD